MGLTIERALPPGGMRTLKSCRKVDPVADIGKVIAEPSPRRADLPPLTWAG